MGWIVLLWGTLFVGKKHGPQKGKVAGAEMSGVSPASPERTGGKGHGREAYGSASRRSSWYREASPSFLRPGPPGRRPRPAPRAGDQSPAVPWSLRVPLSSRLCPFHPLAGWDPGRSSSRTGTPTKEGRDEARGDLPGHRPRQRTARGRRLSTGASLRNSAHAPARRPGGSAGGGSFTATTAQTPPSAHAHTAPRRAAACPFPPPLGYRWRRVTRKGLSSKWAAVGVRREAGSRACALGVSRAGPRCPRAGSMSAASKAVTLGGFWWTPALWGAPCPWAAVLSKWQRDCLCSGTNGWLHICAEDPFQVFNNF